MLGLFEKSSASSNAASGSVVTGGASNTGGSSGDLDDLNRALYDLGAQDLLDVWEAMGSEVRLMHNCATFALENRLANMLSMSLKIWK